ncbi:alpha/beta fold hydrolase [Corynebacterium frankenforstense]
MTLRIHSYGAAPDASVLADARATPPSADQPPVVFVGSIASGHRMWLPQLDLLAHHRRVIALDYHGHGGAPVVPGAPETMDGVVAEVLATLDAAGVDRFDLVGLSLGGAVAQAVASAAPQRVRRLALACTATSFGGAEKWTGRAELTAAEGMSPMVEGVLGLWVSEDFARRHRATTEWLRAMIAAGVAGPVESVVVPGAHVPTFEAREEVNAALTEFLG